MIKNRAEQFPAYMPLYYRIFCAARKLKRQTCVRIDEHRAKISGPADVVCDGEFASFNGAAKVNPKDTVNKSAYWIEEDLSLPGIKDAAQKIEAVKVLLKARGLRYTSPAGMFTPATYTQDSEKRKLWENAWVAAHSAVEAGDKVLDIGGASTAFVFYLASLGCTVKVIDNDWSCCGMIYNTKYVARKMKWDIEVFDRDISKPIPFPDNSFDRVFSICTVEHLSSSVRRRMMREVARVLKPGGIVGLTIDYGPDRKVLIADKGLRFGYRQKLFDEIINPSGLSLYGNDDFVDAGTGKDGFLGAFFLNKPIK
ncbi:MAG: class I SAM-dependent methyltransferase [Candidatus Omnitrophica bacterium]|nr:class I SAM-dependent methyltransferase [Candidatus Omnitrophota bacterium]